MKGWTGSFDSDETLFFVRMCALIPVPVHGGLVVRNICMTVSYDGTSYNGFQSQPGLNTVQDRLERAIALLAGEEVKITASGRTDAGCTHEDRCLTF